MLAIPRRSPGLPPGGDRLALEFMRADNPQREDGIDEFTLNGDAALSGRFDCLHAADGIGN